VGLLVIRRRQGRGVNTTRLFDSVKTSHPVRTRRPYQVRM